MAYFELPDTISVQMGSNGNVQKIPLAWYRLYQRLRSLPDGIHNVALVKSGEDCKWGVIGTGKVEGQ